MIPRICGLTDPFCAAAVGAKWPDGGAARTSTFQLRCVQQIASGDNGGSAFVFSPGTWPYVYGSVVNNAGAGTFNTPTLVPVNDDATIAPQVKGVRLVTAGCRFFCTLSANNASGLIYGGDVDGMPAVGTAIGFGATLGSDFIAAPAAAGRELTWIARAVGSTAHDFYVPSTGGTAYATSSNDISILVGELYQGSTNSASALAVEMYANYEFVWQSTQRYLNSTATAPAGANLTLVQAATNASAAIAPIAPVGVSAREREVWGAASRFAGSFGRAAGAVIAGAAANYLLPGSGPAIAGASYAAIPNVD